MSQGLKNLILQCAALGVLKLRLQMWHNLEKHFKQKPLDQTYRMTTREENRKPLMLTAE